MTLPAPTYDLVLLLDPQAEQTTRSKIVADVREAIAARGELLRHDEWGDRVLAYPIDHKTGAEYHLLQFHASTPELIVALDHSLRITDDIIRFRINKLNPGTPDAPDMRPGSAHAQVESEPAPSEPAPSEPPASEPAASEPAASEPAASEPAASEPAASEPAASEPAASEPAASEPAESKTVPGEPETVVGETA